MKYLGSIKDPKDLITLEFLEEYVKKAIAEALGGSSDITITDDGSGNLIISGLSVTDDGAGNATVSGISVSDDDSGNIEIGG